MSGLEQVLTVFVVAYVAGVGWSAGDGFYRWISGKIRRSVKTRNPLS